MSHVKGFTSVLVPPYTVEPQTGRAGFYRKLSDWCDICDSEVFGLIC